MIIAAQQWKAHHTHVLIVSLLIMFCGDIHLTMLVTSKLAMNLHLSASLITCIIQTWVGGSSNLFKATPAPLERTPGSSNFHDVCKPTGIQPPLIWACFSSWSSSEYLEKRVEFTCPKVDLKPDARWICPCRNPQLGWITWILLVILIHSHFPH